MASREEILDKVRLTLVDALGVDDEEVSEAAKLVDDLGAESIDFLDIVFRLEKNFGLKIPRGELFPESLKEDASLVADGKVTTEGIAMLRSTMPHFDADALAADPRVENIQSLLTVKMIVNVISARLPSE